MGTCSTVRRYIQDKGCRACCFVSCCLILGILAGMAVLIEGTAQAITLEKCIEQSLIESPDIEAAAQKSEAAMAMMKKARAAYYPWVTLSAAYARTDNPPQAFMMQLNQRELDMRDPAFDPNNPDDTNNVRMSLGVKYRVYDFGRRRLDYAMAGSGSDVACLQLSAVLNELIHQISASFFGVLQAQAFVLVQQESVASLQESLRVANERYQAGSAVKTDVLNLEVQLSQSAEDLIRARNSVLLAVAALNTAIGKDLAGGPEDLDYTIPEVSPALPPEEIDRVEDRPELKIVEILSQIRQMELSKAKRAYTPTVNAFGSLDQDGETFSDTEDSYLVGANVEWDLFTGFSRKNSVSQARANLAAAQADVRKTRNQLRLDLKQAYLKAVDARQRLEVTRKSLESAKESLRITQERYKGQAADITELLTAQVGLTVTQSRGVSAYYEYLTELSNLKRAKGLLVSGYTPCTRE
ncbi:MAG TPA: TolC family protein [Deltaproteobacteria bacterium]|nr:TolC family protein [Deltaproteobacteria bacterium]